jgi:hypothetical protein
MNYKVFGQLEWDAWSGATPWKDGAPLIADWETPKRQHILLIGAEGIEYTTEHDEADHETIWAIDMKIPSQRLARVIMEGFKESTFNNASEAVLKDLGFERLM